MQDSEFFRENRLFWLRLAIRASIHGKALFGLSAETCLTAYYDVKKAQEASK